jgi:hypothetical protein
MQQFRMTLRDECFAMRLPPESPLFRRFWPSERRNGRSDRPICLREESHMSNSTTVPAQSTAEQANPYRPLGIKAVIAAALMLKPKQALKPAG